MPSAEGGADVVLTEEAEGQLVARVDLAGVEASGLPRPVGQPLPPGAPLGEVPQGSPMRLEVGTQLIVVVDALEHGPLLIGRQLFEDRPRQLQPLLARDAVDESVEQVEVRVGIVDHPLDLGLDLPGQLQDGGIDLHVPGGALLSISPPSHRAMLAPAPRGGSRDGWPHETLLDGKLRADDQRGRSAAPTSARAIVP